MTTVISALPAGGDPAPMRHGPADPFESFRSDHARVLGALEDLEAGLFGGVTVDPEAMRERVAMLEAQFASHMAAEDAVLYPALRAALPVTGGTIDPLLADHAELRAMLAALRALLGLPPGESRDEQVAVLARDFTDLFRLHIRKEESLVLDVASRVLTDAELAAMAEGLDAFRRETLDPRAREGRRKELS